MARKDDILNNFLKHEILITRYGLKEPAIPSTIHDALNSDIPIIKAIALIVEGSEGKSTISDSELRKQILQFLNEAI